jgi:hypothetical protein
LRRLIPCISGPPCGGIGDLASGVLELGLGDGVTIGALTEECSHDSAIGLSGLANHLMSCGDHRGKRHKTED